MDSVLVLIAAPGSGAIDAEVETLLRHHGGGALAWLAAGEAAELPSFAGHAAFAAAIATRPVDVAELPAANRRKRLLIADMDSTMIEQECIDELGELAGVGPQIRAVTARAMRGEVDFETALRQRVAAFAGLDAAVIGGLLENRITLASGGMTLVSTMRAHGARTALVSGGFTGFTGPVAERLGFHEHRANRLEIANGTLTGKVEEPILGAAAKVEALEAICAEHGFSPDDAIAVGDGANDIPMLNRAGLGVALHAKPQVQAAAGIRVNHGDLTALLYLQGYRKSQFA